MNNQAEVTQPNQNPLANYHFSSEELRVLQECNTESFFQRSLPFGIGLGVGAYIGVKQGYFKSNVKFGALPKVVVGVVVGYFLGKFSYQQKCAEKLMRLPNSKLADMLRQRQKGSLSGGLNTEKNLGIGINFAPFTSSVTDIYSDEKLDSNYNNALNLDTDNRPLVTELDDIYRPSLDNSSNYETELPLQSVKPNTSYEELRKKNREDYMKKQQNPLSQPLTTDYPNVQRKDTTKVQTLEDNEYYSLKSQKNKYGDTWID